ncbi:MAG: sugar phosphate isomerase/epimerase [Kiritimatiellaeota bacterium]|nr:sugar phosphate isomerase/epimerase [Kiritimatiellota bacterium]
MARSLTTGRSGSSPLPRIGTLIRAEDGAAAIRRLRPRGFECFAVNFGPRPFDLDLSRLADEVRAALVGSGAVVSALSFYGNPLAPGAAGRVAVRCWRQLIDFAPWFGTDVVAGFAGRVPGASVEDSLPRFQQVFGELAARAADRGVRLAFENCPMQGDWRTGDRNIAFNPAAWERIFAAVPAANLGLEWDPSHTLCQLAEPLPQLRQWMKKIFHIHAKDAEIWRDILRREGLLGPMSVTRHRLPGDGELDWTLVMRALRRGGYRGAVDIEGWHDPVFRGPREEEGQVDALRYLRRCRALAAP